MIEDSEWIPSGLRGRGRGTGTVRGRGRGRGRGTVRGIGTGAVRGRGTGTVTGRGRGGTGVVCEARMAEAEEKIVGGYFCVVCNKECTHKHHLRNHLLSHFYKKFDPFIPQEKPFACPDCGKPKRDKIELIRHYSWRHGYFG